MLSPDPPRKNKLLPLTTICSKTWNYITAILNTRPYLAQLDRLFKSLCLVFFLKFAKPRLLHRWASATRNNLWKRSWHDTESDPVKWKYRNSQCNFGFPLTLPFKAAGVEWRWGGARWGVKQSDISLPTINGLVVLQTYVVLHVTKSQKSTSDIHCA